MELAEGKLINDIQVQRLALEVSINCFCGPSNQVELIGSRIKD